MTPAPILPPLTWKPISLIPLPEVFIDDTPTGWLLYQAAVRALERQLQQVHA